MKACLLWEGYFVKVRRSKLALEHNRKRKYKKFETKNLPQNKDKKKKPKL